MIDHDGDPATPCLRRMRLSTSGYHVCFIDAAGMLHCWGDNVAGETDIPADLGPVIQVSAGINYYSSYRIGGHR
jgi:hypothetical protein